MTDTPYTVGMLRKELEGVPDDVDISIEIRKGDEQTAPLLHISPCFEVDVTHLRKRPALVTLEGRDD